MKIKTLARSKSTFALKNLLDELKKFDGYCNICDMLLNKNLNYVWEKHMKKYHNQYYLEELRKDDSQILFQKTHSDIPIDSIIKKIKKLMGNVK